MTVENFDEKKILSIEELIENLRRKIYQEIEKSHHEIDREIETLRRNIDRDSYTTISEIIRRFEMKEDRYKVVSELKPTTRQIFDVLKESGGSQRFTDIQRFVGCSSSTLTNALRELIEKGLVRSEIGFYQAALPAWFAQKKLEQKEKTKETSI